MSTLQPPVSGETSKVSNDSVPGNINQGLPQVNSTQQQTLPATPFSDKKPVIFTAVAVLIFLIGLAYSLTAIVLVTIVLIMDKSVGSPDSLFSFLKLFPTYGIAPVTFALAALYFFYLTFKVRNGSKFSWIISAISLLAIPILLLLVSQLALSPIFKMIATYSGTVSAPGQAVRIVTSFLSDPSIILAIIGLILVLISSKKFIYPNSPLSTKARIFLIVIFLILVVPTLVVIAAKYINAQDIDYGYTKASATANYHIYKPSTLPSGLAYFTKYTTGKELAGKQNAVRVVFDIPLEDMLKKDQTKPIILTQVQVDPGFSLDTFTNTLSNGATRETINFPKATNQTGVYIQAQSGSLTLRSITFLTNDNILITLVSPAATREVLTQLALSLQ